MASNDALMSDSEAQAQVVKTVDKSQTASESVLAFQQRVRMLTSIQVYSKSTST